MAASASDWIEIRELTARFNRAFDDGDAAAFAGTFTEDGALEFDGGAFSRRGREALSEFVAESAYGNVHITTDAIIEVDGDRARQRCTVLLAWRRKDRTRVLFQLTGRYDDELERLPEGWRFKRRVAELDKDVNPDA
ncbi:MAG TPA: nuclear transport factor 2 family protein [Solirubrobacterales bacterium]|jgi:ketosteroid isomerase-like protein